MTVAHHQMRARLPALNDLRAQKLYEFRHDRIGMLHLVQGFITGGLFRAAGEPLKIKKQIQKYSRLSSIFGFVFGIENFEKNIFYASLTS